MNDWFVSVLWESTSYSFDLSHRYGLLPCLFAGLQDYSWYCLSVAVKKSPRTLLR